MRMLGVGERMRSVTFKKSSLWKLLVGVVIITVIIKWHFGKEVLRHSNEPDPPQEYHEKDYVVNERDANAHNQKEHHRTVELKNKKIYIGSKEVRILSGAIHYFRVVPEYWEDRLRKLKASGLNTVETYVAWNSHEEIRGEFNFNGILDIRAFIKLAQSLGLYVILRPGPYICSEWEFGGMPSWLLRDKEMKMRSSYKPFMDASERYLKALFDQIGDLQFHKGGPIIMVQIENEYSHFGSDVKYMESLKEIMLQLGIKEPLFTSNGGGLEKLRIPGVLKTANFKKVDKGKKMFKYLQKYQPDMPLMAMEFWTGWFDMWGRNHATTSVADFTKSLTFILKSGASVNLYMFHGGTNFGFMNGAAIGQFDTTSYDYDAPLTESGDVTEKYHVLREILPKYSTSGLELPPVPADLPKASYGSLQYEGTYLWEDMLNLLHPVSSDEVVPMELLDINHGSGQAYGFILYRTSIRRGKQVELSGSVSDRAQILLNSKEFRVLDYRASNAKIPLDDPKIANMKDDNVLDILVENMGRMNYKVAKTTFDNQRKGLSGLIKLDNKPLDRWKIYPLEFKSDFIKSAVISNQWQKVAPPDPQAPGLYRFSLTVEASPKDTFLDMTGWGKGVVFVNGFNLGRYWSIGPTRTLYVPAPLMQSGLNQFVVFELHKPATKLISTDKSILG